MESFGEKIRKRMIKKNHSCLLLYFFSLLLKKSFSRTEGFVALPKRELKCTCKLFISR